MYGGDRSVDARAAIRVLAKFRADEEWLLEPGDMLYLPPGVAHFGVAEGPCFTYSIGFLAPSHQTLVESFLGFLWHAIGPTLDPDALLRDATRAPAREPLALPDGMLAEVARVVGAVRWDARTIEDFFGRFVTSPRRVAFTSPASLHEPIVSGLLSIIGPISAIELILFLRGRRLPSLRRRTAVFVAAMRASLCCSAEPISSREWSTST